MAPVWHQARHRFHRKSTPAATRTSRAGPGKWRWRRDLNPCTRLCRPLPRLSATPPGRGATLRLPASPSGRRDSNPRPSPWQGDALPAALRPHDLAIESEPYPTGCRSTQSGEHSAAAIAAGRHDGAVTSIAMARLGGLWGSDLLEVSSDAASLDSTGRWAVAIPYTGDPVYALFRDWSRGRPPGRRGAGGGRSRDPGRRRSTRVSTSRRSGAIREWIALGSVYQANVCRVMAATLPDPLQADVAGLFELPRRRESRRRTAASCACPSTESPSPVPARSCSCQPSTTSAAASLRSGPDQGHGAHAR